MSLKNEDSNITITPDPMKRLNNITDNRILRKRKRKIYAQTTQSDLLESIIVGTSPNVGKVDAESGKTSVDLEAKKKTLLSAEVCCFRMFLWIHVCPITPPTLFLGPLRLNQLCYLHKT